MKSLCYPWPRELAAFTPVAAACAIWSASTGVQAQGTFVPTQVAQAVPAMRELVVTATRTPERADAVASTITTQSAQHIERAQPVDEAGLFADEPDIDVPRDRRRFGAGSINIRGIEANRVLQMVDGVRLPDFFSPGGPSNIGSATRDAADVSFLKRVEVLRGPASSLYGSDAIGGVVAYATKDPEDVMRDQPIGGEIGLNWNGIDRGFGQTAAVAGGNDTVKGLLMVANRRAHEMDNMGTNDTVSVDRTRPNPQDVENQAWLAKLVFDPSKEHRFKLGYEHRDGHTWTDAQRLSPTLPLVTSVQGTEDAKRNRFSLDYEWKPASHLLDRLGVTLYGQDGESFSRTNQLRSRSSASCSAVTRGTNACDVVLDFGFKQKVAGFNVQADKSFNTGRVDHRLIAGVDIQRTTSEEMRDALILNRTRDTTTKSLAGENFPIHDFPKGRQTQTGVFVQDEMLFADGAFSLTPGLRYDRNALGPQNDAIYERAAAQPAVSQRNSALSPKLSALWKPTENFNVWTQYVYGFRSPSYQEVNGSFRNTVMLYGAIPNADLKPEKSRSFEIGARYTSDTLSSSVSLFDNRYKDFIEQVQLGCPGDPACLRGFLSTYQFRNQSRVRIHGAEWRGSWNFAPQWSVDAAIAYARGRNEDSDEPLNSVSPLRASAGIRWEPASGQGVALRWRGARPVTRTDDSQFIYFKPPGYGVLDLQAWWRFNRQWSVVFSVDNLLDKKYWLWGDVRTAGLAATDPGRDFYTQPGRTFAASVKLSF